MRAKRDGSRDDSTMAELDALVESRRATMPEGPIDTTSDYRPYRSGIKVFAMGKRWNGMVMA